MTSLNGESARAATLALTATFALLTLAACGGGGGGGPTSMMPPGGGGGDQTIPTRAAALTNSAAAANTVTKIAEAAVAQPTPGSVTQSSNVDSSNITIDQVNITAQYGSGGPGFSIRNGTAWSIGTSDGNPRRISDTSPPWQGVELSKRIAGGTLYVDAYTDIEASTSASSDTDYLAGGVWLIVPDDATSAAGFEFGAFADGNDPFMQSNLGAVSGTATYTGDAAGVYSQQEAGTAIVGYLDAEVRLNADFGDANGLGTINGSITSFVVDGSPEEGTLILGAADIGAQNAGFFQGTVSDDGAHDSREYNGKWGGQFYGNGESDGKPGTVAGTFGAHSTDFPDVSGGAEVSIVGVFGVHKQ